MLRGVSALIMTASILITTITVRTLLPLRHPLVGGAGRDDADDGCRAVVAKAV